MHDTATTFVERQPGFYQERSTLSLDEMMKREVDPVTGAPTVVRDLFDYWQERHAGGKPRSRPRRRAGCRGSTRTITIR